MFVWVMDGLRQGCYMTIWRWNESPVACTWKLLGPSEPAYVHIAKSMTCSHERLFFLVPVGMKDDVATVPNWIARCEAAAWPNCHLICLGFIIVLSVRESF